MKVSIYYDGDCPFCTRYVRYTRLKEVAGTPHLIDIRQDRESLAMLQEAGYDLDKGMVADIDGRRYAGADAMQALALLTTRSDAFNRAAARLFSCRLAATALYPMLRMCRNLVLLVLGRKSLKADDDPGLFTLFVTCWGIFAFLHFLVYLFDFGVEPYPTTYLIPLLGIWLAFHPQSRAGFLLLLAIMVVDAWMHMPMLSNHTIMKNFFLTAFLAGGIYSAWRGESVASTFDSVVPVGRALLLVMYVFGVFHKINSGFLDPEISCANTLWHRMPPPLNLLDTPWFGYLTVYGTLVIETAILAFLLIPKFRYFGIVFGIGFHMLLGLSGYALYAGFSALAMVLHVLFLTPNAARRIQQDPLWIRAAGLWRTVGGKLAILTYCLVLVLGSYIGAFAMVTAAWFVVAIPLLALIGRYGKDAADREVLATFLSKRPLLNLVSLAFFVNCASPYLGLKTAQSLNMFANLRLEGGVSNHLVLSSAPGPFGYLEDLVKIKEARGVPYLYYVKDQDLYLTYYDLLNHLEKRPGAVVSYERNGELYEAQSAATLGSDIDRILHPRWFRKWFHFTPVDLRERKGCARDR